MSTPVKSTTKCDKEEFHSDYWHEVYASVWREALYGNQPLEERKKAYENAEKWLSDQHKHLEICAGE